MTHSPADIVAAHQYLYYVVGLPIWEDRTYDAYCKRHGICGGGGSDLASSYAPHVVLLAEAMKADLKLIPRPNARQVREWIMLPEPADDGCI